MIHKGLDVFFIISNLRLRRINAYTIIKEVVRLILLIQDFLASEDSNWLTGQTIRCEGFLGKQFFKRDCFL